MQDNISEMDIFSLNSLLQHLLHNQLLKLLRMVQVPSLTSAFLHSVPSHHVFSVPAHNPLRHKDDGSVWVVCGQFGYGFSTEVYRKQIHFSDLPITRRLVLRAV